MSEPSPRQPRMTSRTASEKAARADRLAVEMRKNLMKRKRQQRDQRAEPAGGEHADTADPQEPA